MQLVSYFIEGEACTLRHAIRVRHWATANVKPSTQSQLDGPPPGWPCLHEHVSLTGAMDPKSIVKEQHVKICRRRLGSPEEEKNSSEKWAGNWQRQSDAPSKKRQRQRHSQPSAT
mmetsp:Transcript_8950/g.15001  ORF Transcript_8950/g.15001 Transcript_8950/m.15001 type:complete len:115 (+) Transcript_8950:202-546(+)